MGTYTSHYDFENRVSIQKVGSRPERTIYAKCKSIWDKVTCQEVNITSSGNTEVGRERKRCPKQTNRLRFYN